MARCFADLTPERYRAARAAVAQLKRADLVAGLPEIARLGARLGDLRNAGGAPRHVICIP
jgi:hypothetical protein